MSIKAADWLTERRAHALSHENIRAETLIEETPRTRV